jgi:hypothetical protein
LENAWLFIVDKLSEILGVYIKLLQKIPLTEEFIHAIGVFCSSPLYLKRYRMNFEEKTTNLSFLEKLDEGVVS